MEHSNTTGISDSATMETLRGLNDKLARLQMGPLILLAVMMIIGFVGNLHVLIFYTLKMKSTNHRNFIVFLSSQDLSLCIIGMPLSIYYLREPLIFASRVKCKLHFFIDHFICIASAFTMLVIAIERYRKICKPFGWQLSRRLANIVCFVVLVAALPCSIPVLVNIDSVKVDFPNYPWKSANMCDVNKSVAYHYYISLIILVIILLIVLIVLYALIWKQTSSYSRPKVQMAQHTEVKSDSGIVSSANDCRNSTSITSDPSCYNGMEISKSRRQKSKSRKLTLAFSLITAVFFISYIPNLVYLAFMSAIDNEPNFSESELFVISMFICFCAYVSVTTNCFIYGFTNVKFRQEVKIMYMKLFCCNQSNRKRRDPEVECRTPDREVVGLNPVSGEISSRCTHSSTLREYSVRIQEAVIERDESQLVELVSQST